MTMIKFSGVKIYLNDSTSNYDNVVEATHKIYYSAKRSKFIYTVMFSFFHLFNA